MAAVEEGAAVADPQTQDAVNSAAAEAAEASTAALEPMMFSDLVRIAAHLLGVSFSGWVVLVLLATLFTWIAYLFSRYNSLLFVLPLTAGLLILFERALLDRSPSVPIWAAILIGVGAALYWRLTWR